MVEMVKSAKKTRTFAEPHLMDIGPSRVRSVLERALEDEANRRDLAIIYESRCKIPGSPDDITNEDMIAGITEAYIAEEKKLQELVPRYSMAMADGYEATRFIASEYGVPAPDASRFKLSYGYWHFMLASIEDFLAQGRPLSKMGYMHRGDCLPTVAVALITVSDEWDDENRQPENVRKAHIHEGLHLMGYEVRDDDGKLIRKGIGRSGSEYGYSHGILEEGLVEFLARRYDAAYEPESTLRDYEYEVKLINWLGKKGIPTGMLIRAHLHGETEALERRVDDTFGGGFFEFLVGLKKGLGYGTGGIVKALTDAESIDVRVFMAIIQDRPLGQLTAPYVNDEAVEGLLAAHYRRLYLTAIPLNMPVDYQKPEITAKREAILGQLPDPLADRIRSNPGRGWCLYNDDSREEAEEAFRTAAHEKMQEARARRR